MCDCESGAGGLLQAWYHCMRCLASPMRAQNPTDPESTSCLQPLRLPSAPVPGALPLTSRAPLQDLLGFSRSNIAVAVAITGPHSALFPPRPADPAAALAAGAQDDGGTEGSRSGGQYAIAARHSTMELWLPVLACACLHDVHSGDIFVAGPRRDLGDSVGGPDSAMAAAAADHDMGLPEKTTLEALGVTIEEGLAGVVWEGCQKAAAPFLPGKARK